MENQNSTITTKVPMGQKIAFGVGMFANQMFPAILRIFMVVLVEDLKVHRTYVGNDLFISTSL